MLDLSTPWRVQPQCAVDIDWANPLTRDLYAAVNGGQRKAAGGRIPGFATRSAGGLLVEPCGITTDGVAGYESFSLGAQAAGFGNVVTMLAVTTPVAVPPSGYRFLGYIGKTSGDRATTSLGINSAGRLVAMSSHSNGNAIAVGALDRVGAEVVVCARRSPGIVTLSEVGTQTASATAGYDWSDTGGSLVLELGRAQYSYAWQYYNGHIRLVLVWRRWLSNAEVAAISANPWQIFQPLENWLPLAAAGGAAALAGDAVSTASALAGLTTGIPIAGAALGVAGGSGALTTAIPLGGVAVAAASADGAASTQITLSGAALAQAVSSAALSAGINMSVAAVAQAAADGTLATAIALVATALGQSSGSATLGQSSGSATLGGGAGLAANAASTATATASLTAQIRVSASAISQAAASAGLFTAIPLAANATAEASASATLGGGSPLATVAVATATAGGELTTVIPLAAAALAAAIAAGGLTVAIPLAGLAAAVAGASADLSAQIRINGQAAATAAASAALTAAGAPGMSLRFAATVARVCTLQPTVARVLTLTTGAAHAH